MSNFTPFSSIALLEAPIRKRVSESGVRLMQTAIFSVQPLGKEPERNLAARVHAASAARQVRMPTVLSRRPLTSAHDERGTNSRAECPDDGDRAPHADAEITICVEGVPEARGSDE